jgi:plasmid stabilization system protein ParE
MANVSLTAVARAEFKSAFGWHAERGMDVAERFQAAFDKVIDLLRTFPEIGALLDDRHRYFKVQKFSYGVVYRVTPDGVEVIGVPHDHQAHPDWGSR